jgi:hypothetical protein
MTEDDNINHLRPLYLRLLQPRFLQPRFLRPLYYYHFPHSLHLLYNFPVV